MAGPVLKIKYDGTEIQDHVLYESARFESQMAAIPGTFEFTVRDKDQDQNFVTGKRIEVTLDDVPLYGGFVTQIARKFAFDVVDTVNRTALQVKERQWVLSGVDYNILFDKLVLRNTDDYLHSIPNVAVGVHDYTIIQTLLLSYLDIPDWLETNVDQVVVVNPEKVWAWQAQGSTWRSQMEDLAAANGQIWYIDGGGTLQWHAAESGGSVWGFSDQPDGTDYIGFRELDADEDASGMVNDAMAWGGDDFTGANPTGSGGGKTVFSRYEDSASETDHGRWQLAETYFGDPNFGTQTLLDLRTSRVVDGPPGSSSVFATSGLKNPAWNVKMVWFDNDVPDQDYLRPGHYVNMVFNCLGIPPDPLLLTLPARSIVMTFPTLQPDVSDPDVESTPVVRFDGTFGIELSDPFTLWRAIMNARQKIKYRQPVITATDDSAQTDYNALGQFIPTPAADSSTTVFTVKFGYLRGSSAVYVDGVRQSLGNAPGVNDYQESDPVAGEITFSAAPTTGQALYVECRTLVGTV